METIEIFPKKDFLKTAFKKEPKKAKYKYDYVQNTDDIYS